MRQGELSPRPAPSMVCLAQKFIREHADGEFRLADIAAAVHASPRTLQYAFARQGTTPMRYLRDVRLAHAHQELCDACCGAGGPRTVAEVARRWHFSNPGRFAAAYLRLYGQLPRRTLRR
ncbi:helix-turn-helix transcriptional regulator [Streptomyces sp. NPDC016845]|uniref:helix-turn-helix transcriptional regulator n=1 Tax=Streptomyces sp. NPDC016845 TaxID=3364972 RepID=UPI0037979FA5